MQATPDSPASTRSQRRSPAPPAGALWCPLADLAVLRAAGADAVRFLHGQLTCDVENLVPRRSRLGAWCSPKGRVITSLRVLRHEDTLHLLLPHDQAATVLQRLRMFVLRAKVELRDVSTELEVAGYAPAAGDEPLCPALPPEFDACATAGGCTLVREHDAGRARFLVIGETGALEGLRGSAGETVSTGGVPAWRVLDVQAGLPQLPAALAERYLPQMLNLDLLDGVSFTKGCYPGQEVVARTQHLGRLKRRMYVGHAVARVADAPPGTALYTSAGDATQAVGEVIAACPHPAGGIALLAVVQMEAASGRPRLAHLLGPEVVLCEPPYGLPAAGTGR